MDCPNCGQAYPDGATVCPHCGAPLPQVTPPAFQPGPDVQPAAAPSVPGSSGIAIASLALGLLSIVLSVSTFLRWVYMLAPYISAGAMPTAEEVQKLASTPGAIGITALLVFGQLLALIGLIVGIVGLSQERRRPTRNGKAFSIIGIVCSCVPLLCCVTSILLAWSGAAGVQ